MSFKSKLMKSHKNKPRPSASMLGLSPQSNKDKLGLVSLEPRILLDAAGFVTGAEVAMDAMVFEDAQLGVEGIFDGTAAVTAETSEAESQNAELMGSLAFADQEVSDTEPSVTSENDPTAGPRAIIYLRDGTPVPAGDDPTTAPRGIIYLADGTAIPEGEDPTAGPRAIIYLRDGTPVPADSDDPTAGPRAIIYLRDGTPVPADSDDPTTAPRGIIYLDDGTAIPEGEDPTAGPRAIIYLHDGTPVPADSDDPTAGPRAIIYLNDGTPVPADSDSGASQALTLDEQLMLETQRLASGSDDLISALAS